MKKRIKKAVKTIVLVVISPICGYLIIKLISIVSTAIVEATDWLLEIVRSNPTKSIIVFIFVVVLIFLFSLVFQRKEKN